MDRSRGNCNIPLDKRRTSAKLRGGIRGEKEVIAPTPNTAIEEVILGVEDVGWGREVIRIDGL